RTIGPGPPQHGIRSRHVWKAAEVLAIAELCPAGREALVATSGHDKSIAALDPESRRRRQLDRLASVRDDARSYARIRPAGPGQHAAGEPPILECVDSA